MSGSPGDDRKFSVRTFQSCSLKTAQSAAQKFDVHLCDGGWPKLRLVLSSSEVLLDKRS